MNVHGKEAAFKPTDMKYRHKFESGFTEEDPVYPFLSEEDPYEATKDEVYRTKWIEDSKILYGEFAPSSKEQSLAIPGRT